MHFRFGILSKIFLCFAIANMAFTNFFKNDGISEKEIERVFNDKSEPIASLDDTEEVFLQTSETDTAFLKERFDDQIDPKMTLDEYIDSDIEVSTTYRKLTNQGILTEVKEIVEDDSDD